MDSGRKAEGVVRRFYGSHVDLLLNEGFPKGTSLRITFIDDKTWEAVTVSARVAANLSLGNFMDRFLLGKIKRLCHIPGDGPLKEYVCRFSNGS